MTESEWRNVFVVFLDKLWRYKSCRECGSQMWWYAKRATCETCIEKRERN